MGVPNAVHDLSLHNFLMCNGCAQDHCRHPASVRWHTLAWTGFDYSLLIVPV